MTPRKYRMLWFVLALVAGAYLLSLLTLSNPAQQAEDRPILVQGKPASPMATGSTRSIPAPEPSGLGALDAEVRWLKSAVNELRKREEALQERVGIIEKAFGPETASIPRETATPRPRDPAHSVIGTASPGPAVSVEKQTLPGSGFGDDVIANSPLPIATPAPPTRTVFAIELASGADRKAVEKKSGELKKRYATLLSNLQPKVGPAVSDADGKGKKELRLIAGPFSNAADAVSACVRLKAVGAACTETVFAGDDF
ncbi:MAG: hypothetical protein VX871_02255 [Pseudomonadota bacterium]|nr:hypothetical protein [Pseudomonadota bacterium]